MTLMLDLRAGERLLINGAGIEFEGRSRICLLAHARFLFGKQIMAPEDATTPLRQLQLAVQDAYVGDEAAQLDGYARAVRLVLEIGKARPALAMQLGNALAHLREGRHYAAVKVVRGLVEGEREDE